MDYDYEEPAEGDKYEENVESQVENDEIDANEAAFLQGYNADEDSSFEGEDKEE